MSEIINEVRPSLDAFLEERVSKARQSTQNELEALIGDIPAKKAHAGQIAVVMHSRTLRGNALRRFLQIKNEFNQEILHSVRRSSTVEDLVQLGAMQQRADEERARKKQLEAEKVQLEQKIYDATNDVEGVNLDEQTRAKQEGKKLDKDRQKKERLPYDMFVLYSADAAKPRKAAPKAPGNQSVNTQSDPIKTQVANLHQSYVQKKRLFLLLGLLVSLACAVADFSIIQAVLIAANLPRSTAVYSAVLSAMVLDVPPYILGFLTTARQDRSRLEIEVPGAPLDYAKSFRLSIWPLRIGILLIVLAYVFMRLVMFLGGGDFNLGLHSILEGDFSFQSSRFNSADVLSIFIPIATSAVAYGVSFLLAVHETDYVRSAIEHIRDGLLVQKLEVERRISASDAAIKTLDREIEEKKEAIEASFLGRVTQRDKKSRTEDTEGFIPRIIKAYRRQVIPQFLHEYQLCAAYLRADAERDLASINPRLLPYSSDPMELKNMEYDENESQLLNEIWSEDEGAQGQATKKTLLRLHDDIESLLRIYENQDTE